MGVDMKTEIKIKWVFIHGMETRKRKKNKQKHEGKDQVKKSDYCDSNFRNRKLVGEGKRGCYRRRDGGDWMRNHDRKRIRADTAAAWTARDRKFGLVWLWVVVLVVVFVLGLVADDDE
ncbi:transmembrane protein, putative [Medicago truncatula]|nr:transmembrane protein, putative [Medicago truncatula]